MVGSSRERFVVLVDNNVIPRMDFTFSQIHRFGLGRINPSLEDSFRDIGSGPLFGQVLSNSLNFCLTKQVASQQNIKPTT